MNRSNKKGDLSKTPQQAARGSQRVLNIQARPDSGIVLDDGSEESGSVTSSGVRYNDSNAVLQMLNGGDQHGFVFGNDSSTPGLSLQTPTSVFDPGLLSTPAQLIPRGHAMTPNPQIDFTRLWTDEMVYNMTNMGDANRSATPQRNWEDRPPHMTFYESTTPNLF